MDWVSNPHTYTIRLQPTIMEKMKLHVASTAPEEACGILGGSTWQATTVIPIENVFHSPVQYRMDPKAQWDAFQSLEMKGLELIGIYHSHPSGPEEPSLTDVEQAYYPEAFYVIWFRNEEIWQCSAFRIINSAVSRGKIIMEAETK